MKSGALKIMMVLILVCLISGETITAGKGHAFTNCAIQDGPCIQEINGIQVTLDVLPRPVKAMQDLTFKVIIEGSLSLNETPYIDLNMPAMDMGRNRVRLKSIAKNVFKGTGVIVRCKSGRRTWRATVNLPGVGKVDYIFDIIY